MEQHDNSLGKNPGLSRQEAKSSIKLITTESSTEPVSWVAGQGDCCNIGHYFQTASQLPPGFGALTFRTTLCLAPGPRCKLKMDAQPLLAVHTPKCLPRNESRTKHDLRLLDPKSLCKPYFPDSASSLKENRRRQGFSRLGRKTAQETPGGGPRARSDL